MHLCIVMCLKLLHLIIILHNLIMMHFNYKLKYVLLI